MTKCHFACNKYACRFHTSRNPRSNPFYGISISSPCVCRIDRSPSFFPSGFYVYVYIYIYQEPKIRMHCGVIKRRSLPFLCSNFCRKGIRSNAVKSRHEECVNDPTTARFLFDICIFIDSPFQAVSLNKRRIKFQLQFHIDGYINSY